MGRRACGCSRRTTPTIPDARPKAAGGHRPARPRGLRTARRAWLAVNGTWFAGGETRVDGVLNPDLQRNTRLGVTLSIPLAGRQSVKFVYSTGTTTGEAPTSIPSTRPGSWSCFDVVSWFAFLSAARRNQDYRCRRLGAAGRERIRSLSWIGHDLESDRGQQGILIGVLVVAATAAAARFLLRQPAERRSDVLALAGRGQRASPWPVASRCCC